MLRRIALASAAFIALSLPAAAADNSPLWQDYVTPYIGVFDITNSHPREYAQFGVEYRFHQWQYGLRPTLGVNSDVHGGAYAYGGLNWEIGITDSFLIIPNFMIGAYHQGGSKDLGGPLEFRSGLEVDYQFPSKERVGVSFNHISNASIYDRNPGAEALLLNYSFPTSVLR